MNKKYKLLFCWVLLWLQGCVEEYALPENSTTLSHLVVDATVLIEAKTASIKPSRTQNLADAAKTPDPETKAVVHLEDTQNQRYRLQESTPGLYTAVNLSIVFGQEYRLRIQTADGKEYLSAFVAAQPTPPISELTWHVEREGVQVQVSSNGDKTGSRFYRWEFIETYEYVMPMFSFYKYENGMVQRRAEHEYISVCWRTLPLSTNLILGASDQLEDNKIHRQPVTFVAGSSELLSQKYSILVRQYALSRQEYDYWQLIKKNTENVGSLFDAQPSFVTGNLTCLTNPQEVVLGLFSVKSMTEKRLFIDVKELAAYNFKPPSPYCETREINGGQIPDFLSQGFLILDFFDPDIPLYTVAFKNCVDCRTKGGTTTKPSYWP